MSQLETVVDQYSDPSLRVLYCAMQNIDSAELKTALASIEIDYDSTTKCAEEQFALSRERLFPVNTRENVILSKVYFDQQRSQMSEKTAALAESRLDTYLNLHDVPDTLFKYKPLAKAAADLEPVYLLPKYQLCKVASEADMTEAESLFTREHLNLPLPDRVEFAQTYVKLAKDYGVHRFSPTISKYAALLDTDFANTRYLLEARAAAASRSGRSGEGYLKLASALKGEITASKEELSNLAGVIHALDEETGLSNSKYDRKIPCAFSSVFNKEAEVAGIDDEDEEELAALSKAEIIARYGNGIMEEVEDEEGNIDIPRLRDLIVRSGGEVIPSDDSVDSE